MLPLVLHEKLIHPFNFYWDDCVRTGMRYESELYELAEIFEPKSRLKAYQIACELADQEVLSVITVSPTKYRVWVSLRSPHFSFSQSHAARYNDLAIATLVQIRSISRLPSSAHPPAQLVPQASTNWIGLSQEQLISSDQFKQQNQRQKMKLAK